MVILDRGRVINRFKSRIPVPIIRFLKSGDVYVGTLHGSNPGLFYYSSIEQFQVGEGKQILSGFRINDILIDHEGGVWVTTQEGSVFHCINPQLNVYDVSTGLSANEVYRLSFDGDQWVYAGTGNLDVFRIHTTKGNIESLLPPLAVQSWEALYFDLASKRLWSSSPLHHYSHGKWEKMEWFNSSIHLTQYINAKKISRSAISPSLWMSSSHGFFNLKLEDLSATYYSDNENTTTPIRTFAVEEDTKANIWVATIKGLRIWKDGSYHMPGFSHLALRYQARDMAQLPDKSLAIAFAGAGILIYDSNQVVTHLNVDNGLSSNFITKIVAGNTGEILACTDLGLNRLTRREAGNWDVQIINTTNGLPSNLVYDVVPVNNELWIATVKGLVRTQIPKESDVPMPVILKCMADSIDLLLQSPSSLPYYANTINIAFEAVQFRVEGGLQYRYRLLPGDKDYTSTHTQHVTFPNLAPGTYSFELQAGGQGKWSKQVVKTFEIRPPWWKTLWFVLLSVIAFVGVVFVFYKQRIVQIKKASAQAAKIKDLELAALRAQMNPHFIFNCLSSIQQFITQHKPEEASRYLARFAKLVRLALHSSVDGKHSLADEINMLDHYLALEQMRFKGTFEYTIECDPSIDTEAIFLPPLLIQPFIENAVVHGMKNKSNGGQIELSFHQLNDLLQVTITDNGPGFTIESNPVQGEHKSLGMKLTRNRLAMMIDSENGHAYQSENVTDDSGNIAGTKISIRLPLQ
jgi:hypothetical protein